MELYEADPLPEVCLNCQEDDCYNCDYAGLRWLMSRYDELRIKRMGLVKAIERYERQIKAIDEEMKMLENENKAD